MLLGNDRALCPIRPCYSLYRVCLIARGHKMKLGSVSDIKLSEIEVTRSHRCTRPALQHLGGLGGAALFALPLRPVPPRGTLMQ